MRVSGASRCVMTACTPGMASAAAVSMDVTRAWGWGERSTLACSIPGRFRSAVYRARPVTFSASPSRGVSRPTIRSASWLCLFSPLSVMGVLGGWMWV